MASKSVSPGAALLRSSRLFSLPTPIPSGPGDISSAISRYSSPDATLPFPTRQAIASPRASRDRGDWGLKRPLPAKASRATSEPVVRIHSIDSPEQITDYRHATDHTMTLRKWQAMNVPITIQSDSEERQHTAGRSVFEEEIDAIAIDFDKRHTSSDKRWKFSGPWLAGMTEGAFKEYLKKTVHPRRKEFRDFLRAQYAAQRDTEAAVTNLDKDIPEPADAQAAQTDPKQISDAELMEYLRILRNDRPLLYRLVGKFLDLAPIEPSNKVIQSLARGSLGTGFLKPLSATSSSTTSGGSAAATANAASNNPWARNGPPITHPSAGLTYLRSTAYIDNHPLYGPQKSHPPVTARILAPRHGNANATAKLGVAGFVVDNPYVDSSYSAARLVSGLSGGAGLDSAGGSAYSNYGRSVPGLSIIDPSVPGGSKIPVRVAIAKVNSQGRIVVAAGEADPEAVLVQRELEGDEKIYGDSKRLQSTRAESQPRRASSETAFASGTARISSAQTYGMGQ
ncbi:hypothetical protein F503_01692 [Ophiostoma piceae UAMH 11346]|uniref:Uncharacterized protein n=1 Tax=Ophiostoma piceae (strain UAMH 11346) TaxID=1262450 RepID=S3BM14_OPHP1|nr:hypothetical protein F503_01692 [Ophiostoma piceae UAMH 11346]